jgi:hypothetical protein
VEIKNFIVGLSSANGQLRTYTVFSVVGWFVPKLAVHCYVALRRYQTFLGRK